MTTSSSSPIPPRVAPQADVVIDAEFSVTVEAQPTPRQPEPAARPTPYGDLFADYFAGPRR